MSVDGVELEQQRVLDLLLRTAEQNLPEPNTPPESKPRKLRKDRGKIRQPRRCQCGACLRCVEEARWERVFQEKFADPDYYRQPPRSVSSLAWTKEPRFTMDRFVRTRDPGAKKAA